MVTTDRDTCARMLGRALSRYNGLTNSAKLHLITSVVMGDLNVVKEDLFEKKPFRFADDVIRAFQKYDVKPRSAEVHLHHAIAFGFLYRATPGGTRVHPGLVNRLEATSHIALTPLGRACRSANQLKNERDDFQRLLWEYALLECDFDMYALLLKMSEENDGSVVGIDEFFNQYDEIRNQKFKWLEKKLPYAQREIKRNVRWILKHDELRKFEGKTPEHHYNQRKRWANKFGHLDESKRHLTILGRELTSRLPSTHDNPFFWLGPPSDCAKSRFLSTANIQENQCSPAWNFLRPESDHKSTSINELVEKVATYMEKVFELIRLRDFKQAPLDAVMPYVYFLEREFGERVDEQDLFRAIFNQHRDKFVCTLRKNLSQSHYWLRKK